MTFTGSSGQWIEFCAGLFCGIAGGVYFEVFAAVRKLLRAKKVLEFTLDLLFVLLCGITVFAVMYEVNGFDFKWYVLLGFFVGFCLERACFAKPVAIAAGMVYNILKKARAALPKLKGRGKDDGKTADIKD